MSWKVHIAYDMTIDAWMMFVHRRTDTGKEYLSGSSISGLALIHQVGREERMEPFWQISGHDGRDILSQLAGQLAQLGYGALSTTPAVAAMEKHIESLEKQSERLFSLATKAGA